MTSKYKIHSILVSPDAFLFDKTVATSFHPELCVSSPGYSGGNKHIITYECEAVTLNEAWRKFFATAQEFIEAASFYTTSYLAFHDWNHIIINETKGLAYISLFERSEGTMLGIHFQDEVEELNKLIECAKKDSRLKNFLHAYRMAVLLDAPETLDAYEKYLLFACEALAGEVSDGRGGMKYDRRRLQAIIGKDLQKYFFSSIDPLTGKTIRNANMHLGKSPNRKPSETIKLVGRLREFIKSEYGIKSLTILKEEASPTRGYFRDDGSLAVVNGAKVSELKMPSALDVPDYLRNLPEGVKPLYNEEAQRAFARM